MTEPWEIVCFVFPTCDGKCPHCWSSGTYFGRPASNRWHTQFWPLVDPLRIREVRFSGGETLFSRELGSIIETVRTSLGLVVPLTVFTSGRRWVSLSSGEEGVSETSRLLKATGIVQPGVEIHLSADENHGDSLLRYAAHRHPGLVVADQQPMELLLLLARNFLAACQQLQDEVAGFRGGKLKIHAARGRLLYHRQLFDWMSDALWRERVIATEGLVRSGRARELASAEPIADSGQRSLFLMPGATFGLSREARSSQAYQSDEGAVFLNPSDDSGPGAAIVGWWNLINKRYVGGTAYDALEFIGREVGVLGG